MVGKDLKDCIARTQVIILAGGEGVRLRPFSVARPKAFCPVCNVPVLIRLLRQLEAAGFKKVWLALPEISDDRINELKMLFLPRLQIHTRVSRVSKGSIPSVMECLDTSLRSVLVIYGDSLVQIDFWELLKKHEITLSKKGVATMLYHLPSDRFTPELDGRTYHGILSVSKDDCVTRFVEKPLVTEIRHGFELANAAVFVIERSSVESALCSSGLDFSRDFFEPAISRELVPVYGASIGTGYRYDVGTVQRFHQANMNVLNGDWPADIPGTQVSPGIWKGSDSVLDGIKIVPPVLVGNEVRVGRDCALGPLAIIGDRSVIRDRASIRRSVIMHDSLVGQGTAIESSVVGSNSQIGDSIQLPAYSAIGDYSSLLGDRWVAPKR